MRSSTLMPALLALARAAAIPTPTQPAAVFVSDEDLDAAIKEPLVNFVDGNDPVHGLPWYPDDPSPPSANPFKPYREDAGADDGLKSAAEVTDGALAWASLELQALTAATRGPNDFDDDAVIPSEDDVKVITDEVESDGYAFPDDEVIRSRFVAMRARDLEEIAKGPAGAAANATLPADYHLGLTKDQLCTAFRGLMWKTGELITSVYQWQPEYVPWLVDNKGPYIYVLDGLRHIEWVLWKIDRGLHYTTPFTPEEERDISRCWFEFSGHEWQRIRPSGGPSELFTAPDTKGVPSKWPFGEKEPATGPYTPRPMFAPRPSLKKLLRIITAKAPVSRYETYAVHRIHKVLTHLESSVMSVGKLILETIQIPLTKELLLYDIKEGQGIQNALHLAKEAYNWRTAAGSEIDVLRPPMP